MEIQDLLPDMYTMLKDTSEKTAKIGANLSFMNDRLTKTENLIAKMNETLSDYKMMTIKIDDLQKRMMDNTKRIDTLERREISFLKKYGGIFLSALITAAAGFVAVKWGLK